MTLADGSDLEDALGAIVPLKVGRLLRAAVELGEPRAFGEMDVAL